MVRKTFFSICIGRSGSDFIQNKSMLNVDSCVAISVDFVSHLHYQFYNFNMVVVGVISVVEFMAVQARNGKEEEEISRLK